MPIGMIAVPSHVIDGAVQICVPYVQFVCFDELSDLDLNSLLSLSPHATSDPSY